MLHFNLLVKNDQISALIDWGCSKFGDFLYDLAWFTFWKVWHPAMKDINFRKLALQHYNEIGLKVVNFEKRIRCYEIHIGLDAIAYGAFKQNWPLIGTVIKRLNTVLI